MNENKPNRQLVEETLDRYLSSGWDKDELREDVRQNWPFKDVDAAMIVVNKYIDNWNGELIPDGEPKTAPMPGEDRGAFYNGEMFTDDMSKVEQSNSAQNAITGGSRPQLPHSQRMKTDQTAAKARKKRKAKKRKSKKR